MRNKTQRAVSTKAPKHHEWKKKTRHPHCALLRTWVPDRNHGCKALPPSRRNGRPLAVNLFSSRQAVQTSHKYLQLWVLHNHIRFLFTMDIYRLYFTITTYKLQSITFIIRVFAILLEFIVLRDFSGHSAPTWSSPMRNASDSTSNAVYHWNLRFFLHKKRIEKVWKSCRCCWDFARLLTSESVDFCVDFFTFMFFRTSPFTFATCGTSPRRLGWRQRLARRERIKMDRPCRPYESKSETKIPRRL